MDIADKKALFLEKFELTKGNISIACKAANISRSGYYLWRKGDPAFAEMADDVIAGTGDFVESKLIKKINNDDTASIIFYCKTKLRDRGYVERQEIGDPHGNPIIPTLNVILTGNKPESAREAD